MCLLDPAERVTAWSREAEQLTGRAANDVIGSPFADLFLVSPPAAVAGLHAPGGHAGVFVRQDGLHLCVRVRRHALSGTGTNADMPVTVAISRDEPDAVTQVGPELRGALDSLPDGIALFDADQGLLHQNARFDALAGLADDILKQGGAARTILAALTRGEWTMGEAARLVVPDGWSSEILRLGRTLALSWIGLEDGRFLLLCRDITDLRRLENRARFLEQHDDLTGLANLQGLRLQLGTLCERTSEPFAMLYFDLFGFKRVNDSMGHAAGDELLRIAALRVRRAVGMGDIAAHIRGNKFALILRSEQGDQAIRRFARMLRGVLSRPMSVLKHEVTVGVAIGVVRFTTDGDDRDTLMAKADVALHCAKGGSDDGICFYDPELDTLRQRRMDLERDLHHALAREEFTLFYQPFLNVSSGRIVGVEALIRWRHPQQGLIPPGEFIPVAERMGLMHEIGAWTLETACRQAMDWPDTIMVSVNVSAAQFRHDGLVDNVETALQRAGCPPTRLELEITETAMIDDVPRAACVLKRLRAQGVQIALDDFGTGYSSLSFLHSLPFTRIKIDRSFVNDLHAGDGDGAAIVRAITSLCGSLNVVATAEGVETQEQFDYLKGVNCSEIQGFLISRPCPAEDIGPFLEKFNQPKPPGPLH
ncbi:EAL domain-containing protein [Gluconacetobacter takamatsuzukensis]|uniref:EAL domain-containing protein n=2 Tax=Gluconacetobacter takamatsuzukensis TaxID=1286190 RepID=A0A7W4KC63_9PROT|nr:EAL domain-containing protein [Gluconacetobacter takamatsuzukensis]MBB2204231.1 EAL domain-containing protein [Gluconacetobacter takamatsuzukensis]